MSAVIVYVNQGLRKERVGGERVMAYHLISSVYRTELIL